MASRVRAAWRFSRVLLKVAHGAWVCAWEFPRLDAAGRMKRVQWWARGVLRALEIELEVVGAPSAGPVLIVANHVSWLDIIAVDAVSPARFVSKADVRRWPVLGFLVASGGTLFIERERKRDALRVVHQVAAALSEGHTVAVFPEGTTSDGRGLLPFHGNLLQSAVSTLTPIQPIAIRYSDAHAEPSLAPAYVGEMTLLQSVGQVIRADRLRVRVELLAPQASDGADRRELAERLRGRMGAALT
jgi:1-acyl-sn-glycerol-3-phosphate acyltransferase